MKRSLNSISPVSGLDHARLERASDDSIAQLCERERNILRWRFGLKGEREHTLEEIGSIVGLSRERVRQVEGIALRKLQQASAQPLPDEMAAFGITGKGLKELFASHPPLEVRIATLEQAGD